MADASFRLSCLIVKCPSCAEPLNVLSDTGALCENEDCAVFNKLRVVEAPTIQVNVS